MCGISRHTYVSCGSVLFDISVNCIVCLYRLLLSSTIILSSVLIDLSAVLVLVCVILLSCSCTCAYARCSDYLYISLFLSLLIASHRLCG